MISTEVVLIIVQGAILLGGYLLYRYIKQIPEQIHQKSLKKFEHELSRDLEELKADLQHDIEMMRIQKEQLQVYKIKEFTKFTDRINEYFTEPEKIDAVENNEDARAELKKYMIDLGTRLFFFAGDDSVKKYIEWREAGRKIESGEVSEHEILQMYGELMTKIRKDLVYKETDCGPDEYLRTILTDWDEYKAMQ
jgi:uncharacterized membrane-anchored protein YjiN (DUF445 family)